MVSVLYVAAGIVGLVLYSVASHAPPKTRASSVMVLFVHDFFFLYPLYPGTDRLQPGLSPVTFLFVLNSLVLPD